MNFQGKINLLKFKNSGIVSLKGKSGSKKCIVIPIEDNNIFVSSDDNQKAKGAYFDFIGWESRGQFGDTHSLRQSLSKEVRGRMNEEQLKEIPYLGSMKPYEIPNAAESVAAPQVQVEEVEDLPF